jgi:1,4-dihydroxy-2-naphthoate octaprenyltransferase
MTHHTPSWRDWVSGARLRTLPLAFSPVILGSASAVWADSFDVWLFVLCLVVAVALQVGVNYANDYSDGIRGTDEHRVGPARLTGSGRVPAEAVKRAALISFGVAVLAGAAVVVLTALWWLIVVGVGALIAAWRYTGGRKPYGYAGLGEIVVFVFFGLVATAGTAGVMVGSIPGEAWLTGAAAGFFASAVLLVNNLRDIEQDLNAGKRTLAVMLGERMTRLVLMMLLVMPYLIVGALSTLFIFAPFTFLTAIITIVIMVIVVLSRGPKDLITALGLMTINSLLFAIALGGAIAF